MPRATQDSLTHVLLLWVTLLSFIQVSFIIFFFTAGQHGPTKSSLTGGPESTLQPKIDHSTSLPPQDFSQYLVKGTMVTYKAIKESGKIKWQSRYRTDDLITVGEQGFTIQENGYYFLNLQVTLKTDVCPCNGTRQSECMVTLTCHSCDRDLLEGWINPQTCSTGLLGKVEMLSQGNTLEITKIPKDITESESLTHLDIIMLQPQAIR